MRKPDICTSNNAKCQPPMAYCSKCSHAIYFGRAVVGGRVYRWEYSPRFGPLFAKAGSKAEPDWMPNGRHKVWKAFGKWLERIERKPKV